MQNQVAPAAEESVSEDPVLAQPSPETPDMETPDIVTLDRTPKNVPLSFRPENPEIRRLVEQAAAKCPGADGKPNNSKAVNMLLAELLDIRKKFPDINIACLELGAENKRLKELLKNQNDPKKIPVHTPIPAPIAKLEPTPGVVKFILSKIQNYGYFGTGSYLEKTIREIPA